MPRDLWIIFGPTACGKSALALELARKHKGEIINADAMQCYRDLEVLTARPSKADERVCPHHLYGFFDAARRLTAFGWAKRAAKVIGEVQKRGNRPLLVGGTGFYIKALLEGLPELDPVSEERLAFWQERLAREGLEALRDELARCDPEGADSIPFSNPQRTLRALMVLEQGTENLSDWQAQRKSFLHTPFRLFVLWPDREALYARINARFASMMNNPETHSEVQRLLERKLDPGLPLMKAHGVAEIGALLKRTLSRDGAIAQTQRRIRNYAKRQLTWARWQFGSATRVDLSGEDMHTPLRVVERGEFPE